MSQNVSDYIISRLKEWNVKRLFGYPGDGINGIMGALHTTLMKGDSQRKGVFKQTLKDTIESYISH